MDKLALKHKVDDFLYSALNGVNNVRFFFRKDQKRLLRKNASFRDVHKGKRCFILGNGPSLNQLDLSLLRDEYTFVCNFFYKHPQAVSCNPKFYVIVDSKLSTGEWPASMLDGIAENCPNAQVFLNVDFSKFSFIREPADRLGAHWIAGGKWVYPGYSWKTDITGRVGGGNVTKLALQIALHMNFEEIYFLGIDGDGLFRELLGESSHFYDGADNPGGRDYRRMIKDLWFSTEGLRGWLTISDRYRGSYHKLYNAADGGLLNCFERAKLSEVLATKRSP